MGKHKTQQIAEGAMMTALVGVALFINQQLANILEYALYWVLSFPVLIYTVRYGVKQASIPAISMVLLSLFISLPTTTFYVISAVLVGLVYGGGVRNKWSNTILLTVSGVLTLISYFFTMVVFASLFGFDPKDDLLVVQQIVNVLQIYDVPVGQLALLFSLLLTVLTALLQTICVHLFAILILQRIKLVSLQTKTVLDIAYPRIISLISIGIWVLFSMRNVIKLEGSTYVFVILFYLIMCLVMFSEILMDVLSICILLRKRRFALVAVFVIIVSMFFTITRSIGIGFGILSCAIRPRAKWKAGVWNGTFRKP